MPRDVSQLSITERTYIFAHTGNDWPKFWAIVHRVFEQQSLKAVADLTGLPKSTVQSVCERFVPLYDDWVDAFTNPETADETVVEELHGMVGRYLDERLVG